jgi:hypothetical protein
MHQTLEVLALDGESYRLVATHGGHDVITATPFETAKIELAALWSR